MKQGEGGRYLACFLTTAPYLQHEASIVDKYGSHKQGNMTYIA